MEIFLSVNDSYITLNLRLIKILKYTIFTKRRIELLKRERVVSRYSKCNFFEKIGNFMIITLSIF